jgi:Tripartite tricarboxylate transporter TctB family
MRSEQYNEEKPLALQIRHPKDFFAGLIFVAIGIVALVIGGDYSLGSPTRMGPGYFPVMLGWLLLILGTIIALRSLWIDGPRVGHIGFRPLLLILVAILAFAGLLEPAGVVIATIALIGIGRLATAESRLRESVPLTVALIAIALSVFVYGLGLPLKIWPWS